MTPDDVKDAGRSTLRRMLNRTLEAGHDDAERLVATEDAGRYKECKRCWMLQRIQLDAAEDAESRTQH